MRGIGVDAGDVCHGEDAKGGQGHDFGPTSEVGHKPGGTMVFNNLSMSSPLISAARAKDTSPC
jgi:hypothetical protein